jgi:Xaa-Pro aminopeptidase
MNEMNELLESLMQPDFSVHAARRDDLLALVKAKYPHIKKGIILMFSGIEQERCLFRPDSSFYYYSGIQEPGVFLSIDLSGKTTVYVPQFAGNREQWMESERVLTQEHAETLGCDLITPLGDPCSGYQMHPFSKQDVYRYLLKDLKTNNDHGGTIFVLAPDNEHAYITQRLQLASFLKWIPSLEKSLTDISDLVAQMRRVKDVHELDAILNAILVTKQAHEAAVATLADGDVTEADVKAAIEHTYVALLAKSAFPSIVATGMNGTILHYTGSKNRIRLGDTVVVDIGADVMNYCADITRTYPASGTFTKRQRDLYTIVLDTQHYIAQLAKPGMWLSNANYPEESLNHRAKAYLAKKGYDKYFPHGIGHFLGLDVHDVGDYAYALQPGDVITIEPGIYIPQEGIGIRIEDDYLITDKGSDCLSKMIPKSIQEIELAVQQGCFEDDGQQALSLSLDDDADQQVH